MRYLVLAMLAILPIWGVGTDGLRTQEDKQAAMDFHIKDKQDVSNTTLSYPNPPQNTQVILGLSELLKAANSNYSLQSKVLSVQQAKKNHTIAQATFLPTLNLDYTFQNNNRDTQQYKNYNTQVANAKFNLDVFNGFNTINSIREKNATYRSSIADMEYTRQNIYLQVIQQYYQYFDNNSQLISLQRKLDQINADIQRVTKLYNQGLATIDDLESLKAQGSLSEYQISDAKLSIEQNKLMLEYLTNLSFDTLKRNKIADPTYGIQERQDLTALKEQINAQIYQNKQLNFYPTISVFDTWSYNIQKPAYALSGFGALYPTAQNVLGVTVTLKLFDDIGLGLQKQYLKLGQMANEKNLLYKELEQKKDEKLYRKSLEIAKAKIASSEASLKSATISFQNIKKKYDAQLINFTDYLQALSTKFDAEATYNQSLNNYELQKANYIFYSGQKIQDYIK
ncbi:hypothetical protein BKH46_01460 [Helicobacter sp. 12S02634-8]|uniref:TolC family protein n=1 Tax=Helicobacter sp. 12S02634-8 TaxID=1476199 RepID=UPI000BA68990|nr:TolC family protein [Helicobacter sp. 12S02634-8]PAF48007.1 hypothetical protein BKH46_01460 [Helicobacter sp. 12S02634-8]